MRRLAGPAAGLLFSALLAAGLETGARLLPDAGGAAAVTRVLRLDPELFWTQRPGLDTVFAGAPLRTNSLGFRGPEPAGRKTLPRVAVMGASPAFGWGVEAEKAYPALLAGKLAAAGRPAETINASVIGYSSFQGLRLLRRTVLPLRPDLVVAAYGVNDPDKYRFLLDSDLPDPEVRPPSPALAAAINAAASSRAAELGAALLGRLLTAVSRNLPGGGFRERRRVPPDVFEADIRAFVREARAAGVKVLLTTNPFLLPPGAGPADPAARARADALAAEAAGPGGAAALRAALEADPGAPRALFLAAASAPAAGRAGLLKKARAAELADCMRLIAAYNASLRRVAAELKAPLCDLELLLSPGGAGKPGYFLDPARDMVHLSPAGHEAAAAALSRAAKKMIE